MVRFSPELTFLLMACTVSPSPEKQEQLTDFLGLQPVNWHRVYTLAVRHRLTPFLYRSLYQIPTIPESFIRTLQQDCRTSATDSLLKLHHYHQLAALLAENNIDHLPLKGVHLAEQYYPDSSLRISGDIDILVRREDAFRAIRLLQANEYQLNNQQRLHWQQGEVVILDDLTEVSLYKPFFNNSHFDIDLHWKILCFNQHYGHFDLDYVRAQPDVSAEREIVFLVVHHGINNVWQQLYYINDLYFLLHKRDINWPFLLEELRRYGIEQVFLAGLYWCVDIWALPLPPTVEPLVNSAQLRSLADKYTKTWEANQPSELSELIVKQTTLLLNAQTRIGRRLTVCRTFLSSRIFKYSIFRLGNRFVYAPKELGLLTLFVRAGQSLNRFLPTRR
ncbi:nucleotidyltransferase family protein [Spirosoma sp.]|uniref:nucleotidyltransferase domain-containing protein n=1 Tax=Spirosoma sp. TaxID=1899569 RepID=UPI002620A476|nr:nucleotidyltransferase family protein [Spirosoma sp.]MCX6217891.1 nucleotidyltransferase family protein [Spirosoma sp.]